MHIEIKKLTVDLLDDWLDFFNKGNASTENEWAGCYCMAPHWNKTLQNEKAWEYSKQGAIRHRKCAEEHIKNNTMQGYLAYCDGLVIGWCNTNNKLAYDSIFFQLPWEESEKNKKVKAIACFFIDLNWRAKGIATKLLDKIIADAVTDGYQYIEAYPLHHDNSKAFTGPISLYKKAGFIVFDDTNDIVVTMRKYL